MRLSNFRGFESFQLNFAPHNYLLGPNNAGKSTILTALRLVETLLRVAHSRNSEFSVADGERRVLAYAINLSEFPALADSIHFDFYGDQETRLEVVWSSSAKLTAVWPPLDEDSEPFFYLENLSGMQPKSVSLTRSAFPLLGVIPVLTPVEHTETLLKERYVRASVNTRLASRHLRNNLYLLGQGSVAAEFYAYASEWTEEVEFERVTTRITDQGICIDLFYNEPKSRVPKELVWAGDGIQIWLQILFHLFRIRELDTVILDEPEVYLHPDLQRRLVRILEGSGKQIIMATHSAEVIGETNPADVILIDKRQSRGVRAKTVELEQRIGSLIGTQFNLRLAKALRSKVVVFVEGDDLQILRPLFGQLGLTKLARESGVSFIDLGGFSMWEHLAAFEWFVKDLLKGSVETAVLLDRDYRSDQQVVDLESRMCAIGLAAHIWRRKEIESYLVTVPLVTRATKEPLDEIVDIFQKVTVRLETITFSRLVAEAIQEKGGGSQHHATVTAQVKKDFDGNWSSPDYRYKVLPPKQLLAGICDELQATGRKAVSIRALARAARRRDLDSELIFALERIENML
ncbi:MAG TPA: AAA family ATPase [Jatrophihabitans sp.]|uniref:ATP-dependent nuclease n=1 Tax=Jatrophihabitans sp. TaxID=1932789 RepID=UPI002F0DE9B5